MTAGVILPQSGSGRLTRLVRETVPGTTPTSATWLRVRNTGGQGTSSEIETIESNELPGDVLGIRDVIRTGERGVFELPFELVYDGVTDIMLESLLNNTFQTDVLVPGTQDVTFTLEDELPSIAESEYIRGAKTGTFSLSMQAGQIVTGSYQGQGAETDVASTRDVLPADGPITFTAPDVIDYSSSSLPGVPPVAGDYVRISGANVPTNNGYYKIAGVAGNLVTVFGTITSDGPDGNVTSRFTGQTQYVLTSGTGDTKSTVQPMKCGNNIEAKIDDLDVLEYGLRFPQVDFNITTALTDLREITEDAPYATLPTDRTVEITINYHVITLNPIRRLRDDIEFKLELSVTDPANNKYTFTFPRCKGSTADKGPASRGEVMTGNWGVQGLLNAGNVNVQVARAPGP